MKNQIKLLSTSLIFALSFVASQASYGMDNNDHEGTRSSQINPHPKNNNMPSDERNIVSKFMTL